MLKRYYSQVEEILEDGSAIIIIPDEMINDLGWFEGDILEFVLQDDGSILVINCDQEFNNAVRSEYEYE